MKVKPKLIHTQELMLTVTYHAVLKRVINVPIPGIIKMFDSDDIYVQFNTGAKNQLKYLRIINDIIIRKVINPLNTEIFVKINYYY